jgi:hypothetical protein
MWLDCLAIQRRDHVRRKKGVRDRKRTICGCDGCNPHRQQQPEHFGVVQPVINLSDQKRSISFTDANIDIVIVIGESLCVRCHRVCAKIEILWFVLGGLGVEQFIRSVVLRKSAVHVQYGVCAVPTSLHTSRNQISSAWLVSWLCFGDI